MYKTIKSELVKSLLNFHPGKLSTVEDVKLAWFTAVTNLNTRQLDKLSNLPIVQAFQHVLTF
jgi:hypothetical protein